MKMKEEKITRYARLLHQLDLTAIEIREDGETVRLERDGGKGTELPKIGNEENDVAKEIEKQEEDMLFRSPIVGVFYQSSREDMEPFVTVGSKVRKGDTLCLIEAMKLLNEIRADEDCTILEVLAKNGEVVEYGTPLFRTGRG